MRHLIIAGCLLLCVSCADSYNLQPDEKYGQPKLSSEGTAYIALPADGRYGEIHYDGSGAMVAQALQAALLDYMVQVDIASGAGNYSTALNSAWLGKYTYLFFPTITHWEDRATEWSGIPDKIALRLVVVDVASEQALSSATIDGTSGWATLGGDRPQDLLPEPIKEYVDQLFR
jgi:hypothetical protein